MVSTQLHTCGKIAVLNYRLVKTVSLMTTKSLMIKRQDKQILQQSRTLAENNFSEIDVFIRANFIPGEKLYAGIVTSHNTKNGTTKKVIVFGDNIIGGIKSKGF